MEHAVGALQRGAGVASWSRCRHRRANTDTRVSLRAPAQVDLAVPRAKLSKTTISAMSSLSSASTVWEPMSPAPPITTNRLPRSCTRSSRRPGPGTHGTGDRFDDSVLAGVVQIGVHGDAEHRCRQRVGDAQVRGGPRIARIGGLNVQGSGVVHGRRHALADEARGHVVALADPDRVVRPCRREAVARRGHGDGVGEGLAVGAARSRARAARSSSSRSSFSSRIAACSVSSRPLSPMRTLSYLSAPWPWTRSERSSAGELVVVGEDRAAVAVAAERLGRERSWWW